MSLLKDQNFVCLDCEATGLDLESDRIIEIAAIRFTLEKNLDTYETLIDPEKLIPEETISIHHITNDMVVGKPKIADVLPYLFDFIGRDILVGHGIKFDIDMVVKSAKRLGIPCSLEARPFIDTLRLARLYGESPSNSLETLRKHFNIDPEGAHRAMSDVVVNILVFKHLVDQFKTTEQLFKKLSRPIEMRVMPLGKYKGRQFSEIPIEYLRWASYKDFDQDLLFSIRTELGRRKKGNQFEQAANPFNNFKI